MNQALFDKDCGYYKTKNPIGKNSDFITAPEISQVFGELIAAYLLQIFGTKKGQVSLVEMGAGKGTLFGDIVNSIKKLSAKKLPLAVDFFERVNFSIIEINPVLKQIQQENLASFKVKWYENFSQFSSQNNDEIFFISNELFDCFAIDQFVLTESGWRERTVVDNKFTLAEFNKEIHQFVEKRIGVLAPIGAVFEYSKTAEEFMNQLCSALQNKGGMAINIDYGYIKNDFYNSLQALKNHQKVDILKEAPNCDITAHVNFFALDEIAKKHQLNSSLISQRQFLQGLGIEERRKKLIEKNPQNTLEINSAIDRLIDSAQMGELFKTHIIWK